MKQTLIILHLFLYASLNSFAENNKQAELENQVHLLKTEIKTLKQNQQNSSSKTRILLHTIDAQAKSVDSLRKELSNIKDELEQSSSNIKKDINVTNENLNSTEKAMKSAINTKSVYAGLVGLLALILSVIIFVIHKKKANQSALDFENVDKQIALLKGEQQKLQENIVVSNDKLISAIEKQAVALQSQSRKTEVDHSLALAVANELTRIQQNLNFMDPTVKGVSQLKNRAKAIWTTLKSKQYEIPELIGKVYHEGDNIIATMELNEDLEEGTNRIKRVIKPQVSYKGKLIQAADVVVEFNE